MIHTRVFVLHVCTSLTKTTQKYTVVVKPKDIDIKLCSFTEPSSGIFYYFFRACTLSVVRSDKPTVAVPNKRQSHQKLEPYVILRGLKRLYAVRNLKKKDIKGIYVGYISNKKSEDLISLDSGFISLVWGAPAYG